MTCVSLSALTRTYAGAPGPALRDLTLSVEPGEIIALLGPSGCGKSTTLKLIAGLLAPSAGDITFDGTSVLNQPPEQRGAVMVFQNHLLFPHMSVAQNIGFGLRMRGALAAQIAERVREMLALVQLPDIGARAPGSLSGGQQQRVALARALILSPKVLLLDEPLSNLDAHLRAEMRDLIRGLQRKLGITTIVVTHDQQEAVVLADRIALMLEGSLRQLGAPEDFYKRPADAEVARFFGGTNFIPGTSAEGVFQSALGSLQVPDTALTGPGILTFRPESVQIGGSGENSLRVRLVDRLYLGSQTRLQLEVGGVQIEALVSPDQIGAQPPGAELAITLPRASLWVLAG